MILAEGKRKGKPVAQSAIEAYRVEFVSENSHPHSLFFGGRVLEIATELAARVASQHAETKCSLEQIDSVRFLARIKKGEVLICNASVNRSWKEHLEVGVKLLSEDFRLLEQKEIFLAYFIFAVEEESGIFPEIPSVIAETEIQKKRFSEAESRRLLRLNH